MSMIKKKLPVGIDDFSILREEDYYYLDKTRFIGKIIRTCGIVDFLSVRDDSDNR